MDEYDYLEAQLEGAPAPAQVQLPPPPPQPEKDLKHRSRSRSRTERKSSRSDRRSRSRSRDRKRRSRSRSRDKDRRSDYHGNQHGQGREGRGGDYSTRPYSSRDRREQHQNNFRPHNQGYKAIPPVRMDKETTPPEVRLQREKEQEQKDLERTVRTVMSMNLNLRATEKDVFDFFGCVGQINDIRLICDKNTKRSKGIAYIEFGTVQSAINAVTLNGQVMMGMPVLVKPSEAEKNLAWEAQEQAKKNQAASMQMLNKMGAPRMNPIKLQILNLHPDIGDEDLKELFAPFGEINYTHVVRDAQGASTGEAYAQYGDLSMAENAIKHFNGFELAGKKLSVAIAPLYSTTLPGQLPMPPAYPGMLPMPPPMMLGMLPPPPGLPGPDANAGAGEVDDLDEAENKSFKLNAQSRQALMSRLASSAGLQAPPSFLGTSGTAGGAPAATSHVSQQVMIDQGLLGPASPIPTPCILLRNMFSDADKAESGWEADVADDVRSEASKFGEVLHCHVDPASKGHVYLKFAHQQAAEVATRTFNGRYYSGNQIVVSYQFLQPYNAFFGLR